MRHLILLLSLVSLTVACTPADAPDRPLGFDENIIDLTHPFDEETIFWPTAEGFELDTTFQGYTDEGFYYEAFSFCTSEHGGTHLDAPIHFAEGQQRVDEIPLEQLIGEGILVNVSDKISDERNYQITRQDLEDWEAEHGEFPEDAILLLKTGFGQYWPDREQYMGTAETGEEALADLSFPGLHPEAAAWLAEERSIAAVGIDTPSIDYGPSTQFQAHQNLFQHNILAFENVANLDQLPTLDFTVIALPMKIAGGSGAPLRIIAIG